MVSYNEKGFKGFTCDVLILVVMEDGLVLEIIVVYANVNGSLNPCCNGRWSRTTSPSINGSSCCCLNPCCNGRWSRTIARRDSTLENLQS